MMSGASLNFQLTSDLSFISAIASDQSTTITSGGLTVSNQSGTNLTLTSANTYTGGTTISNGTLELGVINALPSATAVTLANTTGALLDLNSFSQTIGRLSGGGTSGGHVKLGTGTLTFGDATDSNYNGIIRGSGSLIKEGAGTSTLSGVNTYTGGTTLSGGTLSISKDSNLGSSSGGLSFDGGTLLATTGFTSSRAVTLKGAGTIDVNATSSLTMSGAFSESGSLTKTGAGTLILAGTNGYTGGTTVSDGILQGSTTSLQGTITNNASVIFDQAVVGRYAGNMSGSGSLMKKGLGKVIMTANNTYAGLTTIDKGTLMLSGSGSVASSSGLILNNASIFEIAAGAGSKTVASLTDDGSGGSEVKLNNNSLRIGSGAYSGAISGTGGLTKTTSDQLILTGNNRYIGLTTIDQGTLTLSGSGSVASSSGLTLNTKSIFEIAAGAGSKTVASLTDDGSSGSEVKLNNNSLSIGSGIYSGGCC